MKKHTRLLLMILLCLVMFSGTSHAQEPIYIALSAPITGDLKEAGISFKNGIELALGWINEAGGINGRSLELIVGDSQGDAQQAKRLARKFADDPRIVAVIGEATSGASMAAQPIYHRAQVVQLSPTAAHPSFASGSPYSFGINSTTEEEPPFIARVVVNRLGKKKLAMLYVNNDWGITAHKFFVEEAQRLGAEIVAEEAYLEKTTDFTPFLEKLRAAAPELLHFVSFTQEAGLILKQRQQIGWNDVMMIGTIGIYSPQVLEQGGTAAENLLVPAVFFPQDPQPEVQRFVKGYKEWYNNTPGVFAAQAYDAMNILAEALKKAGTDRQAIRDALAKIENFPGVTGNLTFGQYGTPLRDYGLLQVKNGEFVLYEE